MPGTQKDPCNFTEMGSLVVNDWRSVLAANLQPYTSNPNQWGVDRDTTTNTLSIWDKSPL